MAEPLLEFDPTSEDTANSPLSVWNTASYGVTAFNPDAANQTAQWASSVDTEGALPASVKDENRTISMTIECLSAAALRTLQAKVTKISRERGTLKYTLPNSEVVVFDLLTRESFKPEFDDKYVLNSGAYCTVQLGFTAKPYGRGPSVTLTTHTETTLPAVVFTETGIKGDVPATGDLQLRYIGASTPNLWLWGLESRYYSSASTAALQYEAEALTLGGTSALVAGPAGASGAGSNVMRNTGLGTSWVDVLNLTPSSGAEFTHVGRFRVIARVQLPVTNTGTISVRMKYGRGIVSGAWSTNDSVTIDASYEGTWRLVDLGEINLPPTPSSMWVAGVPPVWSGLVQALSTVASGAIYIDHVVFIPTSESSGEVTDLIGGISDKTRVRHDGVFQNGTDGGGGWLPVQKYEGDYLRVPVAGSEARTLRIIARVSRGALLTGDDAGIDDMEAILTYTPRYLVVPSP